MNIIGTIYKIENLINSKVYIGQTINNPTRRFNQHQSKLRKNAHDNSYLQNAWNKYTEENFKFKIINKCPIAELDEIEISLISKYNELGKCYNLETGGHLRKELHEDTRKLLSEALTEKWKDKQYLEKMKKNLMKKIICINTRVIYESTVSASEQLGIKYQNINQVCRGNNISTRGVDGKYYQFAYYEEGKIYKLQKLKNNRESKAVVCVNTGKIYNSSVKASEEMNAQQGHISACCLGKRNFAGRMDNGDWIKWVFEKDYDTNYKYSFKKERIQTLAIREKISYSHKQRIPSISGIKAISIKTKEIIEFVTVFEAVEYFKLNINKKATYSGIYRCLKKERKTAYGFKWIMLNQ